MCNAYRMTSSVEAMRRLIGVASDSAPNLPVFDEIYPDRDALVIINGADATRRIALMRWAFPPPVAATRPVTNVRNLASPFWRAALSRPGSTTSRMNENSGNVARASNTRSYKFLQE